MNESAGLIWIITGPREVGKTRFCTNLVARAREESLCIEGVICPAGYAGKEKISIEIENLKTREQNRLARVKNDETDGLCTDHWIFDPVVMEWGNQIFDQTEACDLLVVDELGPLEFKRGEGWQKALMALDKGNFKTAIVVIRPELLEAACSRWPNSKVIEIPSGLTDQAEEKFQIKILSTIIKSKY